MKRLLRIVTVMIAFIAISVFIPLAINQGSITYGNACYGNNFIIEMETDNSTGTTKRLLDISSPFSGAYLYENVTVVGRSEITDSFQMNNFKPGTDVTADFEIDDIFGSGSLDMDAFGDDNPGFKNDIYPSAGPENSADPLTVISPESAINSSTDGRTEDFFRMVSHYAFTWLELF